MITYKFDVTQSRVRLTENSDKATEGNINVIKCVFNLSEEYNNLLVDAVFNGERVPLVNGECFAPSLTGVSCTVGIIGYELDGDEYKLRISPSPSYFTVEKGSFSDSLFEHEIPKPDVLEMYYNQIKELVESGRLKGDKGDKGDKGEPGEKGEKGDKGDNYVVTADDRREIASQVYSLYFDPSKYGVCYDLKAKNPTLTRLSDARYLKAKASNGTELEQNDFDRIYPWSQMKKCTLADDGSVTAYEDDPEYTEDGSAGQVMVEIPKFYLMHYLDEALGREYWYISRERLNEYYEVPKAFIDKDGKELDNIYVSAFMMSSDADGAKGESKSGNVYYGDYNYSNARSLATARGANWHCFDVWEYEVIKALFIVEYATLDSQSVLYGNEQKSQSYTFYPNEWAVFDTENTDTLSYGYIVSNSDSIFDVGQEIAFPITENLSPEPLDYDGTAVRTVTGIELINDMDELMDKGYYRYFISGGEIITDSSFSVKSNTKRNGMTNQISSSSGQLIYGGVTAQSKYRGIENLYGERYTWLDGILLHNSKYYLESNPDAYSNSITNYTELSFDYPSANGFISSAKYESGVTLPDSTSGSSKLYLCDNFSKPRNNTDVCAVRMGGASGVNGGLFELYAMQSVTATASFSARLSYRNYNKGE